MIRPTKMLVKYADKVTPVTVEVQITSSTVRTSRYNFSCLTWRVGVSGLTAGRDGRAIRN